MGIENDLKKIEHAFEWIGKEAENGLVKLFGATEVKNLLDSTEVLLKTDLGKDLLSAGEAVAAGIATGTSPVGLITAVAAAIVPLVEKEGVALGEGLYHLLASMIVSKLQTKAAAVAPPPAPPAPDTPAAS